MAITKAQRSAWLAEARTAAIATPWGKQLSQLEDADKQFCRDELIAKLAAVQPNFEGGGQSQFLDLLQFPSLEPIGPKVVYLRGGIGAGKSFMGAWFACSRAILDPDSRGLISANDYSQLETSTLVALAEFCRDFRIPLEPCASDASPEDSDWADLTAKRIAANRFCRIGKAPVLVRSANKFAGTTKAAKEAGRGLQVRWFWGDEWSYVDHSAFNTVNGRLGRGPGVLEGIGVITSSINKNSPYNWAYDLFDDPVRSDEVKALYRSIPLDTRENITNLGESYVRSLEASYTKELASIELRSEYCTTSKGVIFRDFNRERHVLYGDNARALTVDPSKPIHLSLDFNYSPACAIAAQVSSADELLILREWYLEDSDTYELSADICNWLDEQKLPKSPYIDNLYIYGDASGNQRSANSKQTNWQIVWNTLQEHGYRGKRRYGKANPNIVDTINSCNIRLKGDAVYLHGSQCGELVKDLEQLKWKGAEIDKSDIKRSHLADTLRYLVNTLWPYTEIAKRGKPRAPRTKPSGVMI